METVCGGSVVIFKNKTETFSILCVTVTRKFKTKGDTGEQKNKFTFTKVLLHRRRFPFPQLRVEQCRGKECQLYCHDIIDGSFIADKIAGGESKRKRDAGSGGLLAHFEGDPSWK